MERSPEKENLEVDDALAQKGGTEKVGSEGPVLVSDTSSERREDEEEGSDQGRKTPSPRPNEDKVTSEIERSTSSVLPLEVNLLAPVPTPVESPGSPCFETLDGERRRRWFRCLSLRLCCTLFTTSFWSVFVALVGPFVVCLDALSLCRRVAMLSRPFKVYACLLSVFTKLE